MINLSLSSKSLCSLKDNQIASHNVEPFLELALEGFTVKYDLTRVDFMFLEHGD